MGYAGAVQEPKLLQFPCAYPIKVMARAEAGLRLRLDAIVERHAGPDALNEVRERSSAQAHFVGVTYIIRAENEAQIAALFAELKQCQAVLMVL
jgi:putative lipoic acid-binding regulatory protein